MTMKSNNNNDRDGAAGDGATGYDDNDYGDGRRQRQCDGATGDEVDDDSHGATGDVATR